MARRGKNGDWIGLVAPLAGMVVMLSLISPQMRQMISAIGFLAICLLGLVVVGFVGFGVYRFAARPQRAEAVESDADWKPVNVGVNMEQKPVAILHYQNHLSPTVDFRFLSRTQVSWRGDSLR